MLPEDYTKKVLDKIVWKPNKKQELFLSLPWDGPFKIKEAILGGGAGSGKTDVLLLYGIVHRWHENPLFKQLLLRRTLVELKNEVVPRSQNIFPKFGATLNKQDMIWTFPRPDQFGSGRANSGAIIKFGHCEEEKDVKQYDSMQICLFTPDEIEHLTQFIYLYICQERNRAPAGVGLPSITRGAGMPGGVGHKFVYERFVKPAPKGNVVIIGKAGIRRFYVHATVDDNIEHTDPTYAQSLDARPDAERKAKRHGDWTAYQGQVFDEFRDRRYPDEPDNALHIVQPFDIPEWWPRFVIGDWGYRAMCYVGFYAVSPNKRLYLYRELHWLKTKIAQWAPEVKYYIEKENPRIVKFCQSAHQDRGLEKTIEQQINDELGLTIELSGNRAGSRVAGKILIHEYLRWKPKPKLPKELNLTYDDERARWLLRNKGLIEYNAYLALFNTIDIVEDNIPKLQIFLCNKDEHIMCETCCPIMIDTIKACSYDKNRADKPAEDVAEFDGDDPYDDLRYACDTAENYFTEAADEFEKIKKQQEYTNLLIHSQDQTAYYMNMRRLENSGGDITSISRYHRIRR